MNIPYSESALILVGHGSTLNADSSGPTHAHARSIRQRGIFREVHSCFWKEEPSMREVFRMVESDLVYVVPVFISEGYFTQTVIPRELGLRGTSTRVGSREIYYCHPVGSHPRMTEALLRRARDIAPDVPPATTSLFIVGHGTDLNDNSARAAKEQAARIRALGKYAQVVSSYMEEPPWIADWDKASNQANVVIVPFFIADGLHSYQDIPVLIGIETKPRPAANPTEIFRRNPYELRGKKLFYASAIGTESMMAEVILDQVAACVARSH